MKIGIAFAATALLLATQTQAQIAPEENIKKILKAIDEEMREIDRLLMESSRQDAAGGMEKAAERLRDLMQQGQTTQDQVVQDIAKLIEELESMSNSQQSSSSSQQQNQDQQPQSGDKPQDQERSTRQNNPTPEMVDQRGKPEQKPDQQNQQQQDPEPGPDEPFQKGENRPAGARPEDGTERVDRDAEDARWGNLPKYARFLMNRGALPEVPEKYRRLVEAYQKQSHKTGSSGSRGGR